MIIFEQISFYISAPFGCSGCFLKLIWFHTSGSSVEEVILKDVSLLPKFIFKSTWLLSRLNLISLLIIAKCSHFKMKFNEAESVRVPLSKIITFFNKYLLIVAILLYQLHNQKLQCKRQTIIKTREINSAVNSSKYLQHVQFKYCTPSSFLQCSQNGLYCTN